MAALLIVVGLAVSVPPSFSTVEGDHFGVLLHPLFPHVHGSAGAVGAPDDIPSMAEGVISSADLAGVTVTDQAPAMRGQIADESFRSSLAGIVLPTLLAGVLLGLRHFKMAEQRVAHQHWYAPPAPPPRCPVLSS